MSYQQYLDSQNRLQDLVEPLEPTALDVITPACPQWSVHDVLAHLAGAAESFGTETFAGVGTDPWTAEHVASRRGVPLADLLAERRRHSTKLTELPPDHGAWLPVVHDALSHEADIRAAIGAPQLPADVLAAAFPLIEQVLPGQLAKLGTVELIVDGQSRTYGEGEPDLVVDAPMFEFWRAWFGRRSDNQIRSWVRSGDADSLVKTLPVFPARSTDLIESGS
ncbi:MAG: maleylpyruvate isomerase family mycothiol-dependent enzyme [Jatrophihabitans sp.]